MVMYDTLCRHYVPSYNDGNPDLPSSWIIAPNFERSPPHQTPPPRWQQPALTRSRVRAGRRLSKKAVQFQNAYVGSMPCMPARREMHTGRYNFLHRSWGPLEPFDNSLPAILNKTNVYTHLITDHFHYFEDGGATYHNRYRTWDLVRGQDVGQRVGDAVGCS